MKKYRIYFHGFTQLDAPNYDEAISRANMYLKAIDQSDLLTLVYLDGTEE